MSDRPWITVAETSELIITLNKIDETKKAKDLFEKVSELKDPKDNIFWMVMFWMMGNFGQLKNLLGLQQHISLLRMH